MGLARFSSEDSVYQKTVAITFPLKWSAPGTNKSLFAIFFFIEPCLNLYQTRIVEREKVLHFHGHLVVWRCLC
jgi:hypothetical protein